MRSRHGAVDGALASVMVIAAGAAMAQPGVEPGNLGPGPSGSGLYGTQGVPYVSYPYGGMYGSMGNVYSPYYRQFHQSGMSGEGAAVGMADPWGGRYQVNPYAGMYGSMGNVYSPYYRQFHPYGMGGMGGVPGSGAGPGPVTPYHYPYFLPPTMGRR